jgi:hypothetical protein
MTLTLGSEMALEMSVIFNELTSLIALEVVMNLTPWKI